MGAKIYNVHSKLCGGDEKHKPVQEKQRRCVCMLMYLWTVKRFLLRSKVLMSQKSIFGIFKFGSHYLKEHHEIPLDMENQ